MRFCVQSYIFFVKLHANECAVTEWEIKWMSLCFYASVVHFMASLINSLECGSKAEVLNPKQEVSEFLNVDKAFSQNNIVITR